MGVYFGETEITGIHFGEQEITEIFFGNTEIFSVWSTYDGTLPAQYSANGSMLADYRIYGAAGGVGDRTVNLFDKNAKDTANGFEAGHYINNSGVTVIDDKWDVTEYIPCIEQNIYCFSNCVGYAAAICWYDGNKNFISGNAVQSTSGFKTIVITAPANASYVRTCVLLENTGTGSYRYDRNVDVFMLTPGSTAPTSYIPYGYEVDMSVSDGTTSTTTQIYIGDDPLGEDEYVDYGERKIYRKKQVHTDTVTIDGIVWDILGYDHDTLAQHSVTIQAHDVLSDMQFDAKEALFAFDSGLAAGTYHFTVGAQPWYSGDVNKTIQFTLAQALPAGGQLVISNAYNATMIGATISAFTSGTATTATETVTMSEGGDGADLGTVTNGLSQDGVINSVQRALLGSDKWSESAMRQYLNSTAAAGSVWEPKNKWDRPPTWAANTAGFLNGLSTDFIANLGATSKTTALNTVTDGGGVGTTLDKVFLLSRSEVYAGDETTGGEGTAYPYYSDFSDLSAPGTEADGNRIKYRDGVAKYWSLRSSRIGYANIIRLISSVGALSQNYATTNNGIAPACCIPLDDIETNDWLQEKFLKPVDPPVPLPALPTVDGTNIVDYAGQSASAPSKFYAKYQKEGF